MHVRIIKDFSLGCNLVWGNGWVSIVEAIYLKIILEQQTLRISNEYSICCIQIPGLCNYTFFIFVIFRRLVYFFFLFVFAFSFLFLFSFSHILLVVVYNHCKCFQLLQYYFMDRNIANEIWQ